MAGERSGRDDDHDNPTQPPSYYGGSGWDSGVMPAAADPPPSFGAARPSDPPPPFSAVRPPDPPPPFSAAWPSDPAPPAGGGWHSDPAPGWEPVPEHPPGYRPGGPFHSGDGSSGDGFRTADPYPPAAPDGLPPAARDGRDPGARSGRSGLDRGRSRQRRGKRPGLPLWQELPLLLVIAFCLAVLVRTFLLQAFYIPSGSMEDTLVAGDRVLVNKVIYNFRDPARGEVVVFKGTDAWAPVGTGDSDIGIFAKVGRTLGELVGISRPGEKDFIKRVIGVPGDTVSCCDVEGRVFVNGQPLDESYVIRDSPLEDGSGNGAQDCHSRRFPEVVVQPGQVFVMGDHRQVSQDSRCQGQVPIENVIGRAFLIVWPNGRWDSLPAPDTFDTVPAPATVAAPATPAGPGPAAAPATPAGPVPATSAEAVPATSAGAVGPAVPVLPASISAQATFGLSILVPVAGTIRANPARSRLIRRDRGRRLAE